MAVAAGALEFRKRRPKGYVANNHPITNILPCLPPLFIVRSATRLCPPRCFTTTRPKRIASRWNTPSASSRNDTPNGARPTPCASDAGTITANCNAPAKTTTSRLLVPSDYVERGKEQGAELDFLPLDTLNGSPFEHLSKKSLGQVLRVLLAAAAPPQIRVNWMPVSSAEFSQRFYGLWRATPAGGDHYAPVRRSELCSGRLA